MQTFFECDVQRQATGCRYGEGGSGYDGIHRLLLAEWGSEEGGLMMAGTESIACIFRDLGSDSRPFTCGGCSDGCG